MQQPTTNRQVEQFNRMLKAMIAKFMNGRQDNWDINLPAFLYTNRTSPHSVLNKDSLPSSSLTCGLSFPTFNGKTTKDKVFLTRVIE